MPTYIFHQEPKKSSSPVFLTPLKDTVQAEQELESFRKRPNLENFVSELNLNVVQNRGRCNDVYPRVRLDLFREQDRFNARRVLIAEILAQKMGKSLLNTFTGDRNTSEYILRVHITVVSDGSSCRKDKLKNLCGKGSAQGKGKVKLTVSYCLCCRETGDIAVSRQLSRTNFCIDCKCDASKGLLLELEEELRKEISKEVTFLACSRLPRWDELIAEKLGAAHKAIDHDVCSETDCSSVNTDF